MSAAVAVIPLNVAVITAVPPSVAVGVKSPVATPIAPISPLSIVNSAPTAPPLYVATNVCVGIDGVVPSTTFTVAVAGLITSSNAPSPVPPSGRSEIAPPSLPGPSVASKVDASPPPGVNIPVGLELPHPAAVAVRTKNSAARALQRRLFIVRTLPIARAAQTIDGKLRLHAKHLADAGYGSPERAEKRRDGFARNRD